MTDREQQTQKRLKSAGYECSWRGPSSQRWLTVTHSRAGVRLQATIYNGRVAAVTCAGQSTIERLEHFLRSIREALTDGEE